MNNKRFFNIDDFPKEVLDLLHYIEIESDIQFEYAIAIGSDELISLESGSPNSAAILCPAEVYTLESYNYAIFIEIYFCEFDARKRIIEIAVLPFISESDETFIRAKKMLSEILPYIPISHNLRQRINEYDDCTSTNLFE
ncbi:MAG: hypothetical protein R6X28_13525 [Bacteroidales bacterium]